MSGIAGALWFVAGFVSALAIAGVKVQVVFLG